MDEHYDVGIYGLWYGANYGSIITYYALSKVLDSIGISHAMIRNPLGRDIDINTLAKSHSLRFAKEHYEITPLYRLNEMGKLNEMFDTFLLGSDQMWNYHLSKPYQQSYFFDFVQDEKNKIAYGTSFGFYPYNGPDEEKPIIRKNLQRFSAISVRDNFSQRICKEDFGVKAELVYDPVFLCEVEKYDDLINQTDLSETDVPYYFAYILDPNAEFGNCLKRICVESGKRAIVIFNQLIYNESHDENYLLGLLGVNENDLITTLIDPSVKKWLYCLKNAEFVITDSFHGLCFSVIFNKNFLVLKNDTRGGERFSFLLGELGLTERMAKSYSELFEMYKKYRTENRFEIE